MQELGCLRARQAAHVHGKKGMQPLPGVHGGASSLTRQPPQAAKADRSVTKGCDMNSKSTAGEVQSTDDATVELWWFHACFMDCTTQTAC